MVPCIACQVLSFSLVFSRMILQVSGIGWLCGLSYGDFAGQFFAVHVVSQLASIPCLTHWAALLHVLHYVHCTIYPCLLLSSTSSLTLWAYVDADWAGDSPIGNRPLGFVFFLVILSSPRKS